MNFIISKLCPVLAVPLCMPITGLYAQESTNPFGTAAHYFKQHVLSDPTQTHRVSLQALSHASVRDLNAPNFLPVITASRTQAPRQSAMNSTALPMSVAQKLNLSDAIYQALQHRPEITQRIATAAGQGANIQAVKAQYFPQISAGVNSADLMTDERGRQIYSLTATQVVYDFGKIKTAVDIEQAKLLQEQANTLESIDHIAYQTAHAMVNINRYQQVVDIATQQIEGIAKIAEIADLRAKAGISSQADPIQAQSNLEAAQSNLLIQEAQLKQYQQKLQILLGYDVSHTQLHIPESMIAHAGLYTDPEFTQIPKLIAAQAAVQVAKFQKEQTKRSIYPSIHLKGSLNQALNGKNPNNHKEDGMYSSVMLEASSNFFQGGAVRSKLSSAHYAEQAAKSAVNQVYMDVLDQVKLLRVQVENKQQQMAVLALRKASTAQTKALYQEQYKLGTRTVVDLLNAEQAIHSTAQEIENARYDIYSDLIQYIYVTGGSRAFYQLNNKSIQGFEVLS